MHHCTTMSNGDCYNVFDCTCIESIKKQSSNSLWTTEWDTIIDQFNQYISLTTKGKLSHTAHTHVHIHCTYKRLYTLGYI